MTRRALLSSAVGAVLLAAPPAVHAGFLGLEAEIQMVDVGGAPHAIIEVFATFDLTTNHVLNAFSMKHTLTGAPGYVHMDLAGGSWDPDFSLPAGNQNPADSLVRIGGSVGGPSNTTQGDPAWAPDWNQPGIPAGAGWFNGAPFNLQGQAGADFKTPIGRYVVALATPVSLTVEGKLTFNNGTGTPTSQPSFLATFNVQPAGGPSNDQCGDAVPLTAGAPVPYGTEDATTDGPTGCFGMGNDIWFTYVPAITGFHHVSTCDSTFQSLIAVYAGCGCPPSEPSLLACSNCCCGAMGAIASFVGVAGQCYLIQFGGEGGRSGSGTLLVAPGPDCDGNGFEDAYETQQGLATDCDVNEQPDTCQLASGDGDGNGVLDVCETLPAIIAGPFVDPATCHRYFLLAKSNWQSAQQVATGLGGHLAVIDDAAENAWVWQTFSPFATRLWIGLTDTATEETFEWVDGSPLGYTNWSPGEPNNALNEDFGEMIASGSGRWNDVRSVLDAISGVVEVPLDADFDDSGVVDGADLGQLLAAWGTGDPGFDLDCSGTVDGADLGLVLAAWN